MACEDICKPISRDHTVNVSKLTAGDVRQGKGGICILTGRTDCGPGGTASPVNAASPTASYANATEIAAAWDASCPVYQSAIAAFNQSPAPRSVTVGFYDDAAASFTDELVNLEPCFSDCYVITTPDLVDDPRQLEAAVWAQGHSPRYQYSALTRDPATLDPNAAGHAASIGAQLAALQTNTLLTYEDAAVTEWIDSGVGGIIATQDFDTGEGGYTLWYQRVVGSTPAPLSLTEAQQLDSMNINYVECIASGASQNNLYKQGILINGLYADAQHKCCWLQARLSEVQFAADVAQGAQVYDEAGYIAVIDRWSSVFRDAQRRRLITGDRFNEQDDRERGYVIDAPQYSSLTSSDFASRKLPCITARTFDTGHIQGTCLNFELTI